MVQVRWGCSPKNLYLDVRYASQDCCFCFTELTIKQEEDTVEEADNRSPVLEEIGQTGEEEVALEESMTGSPNNVHDRLSGPNVTADAGNRQPNGNNECISKCIEQHVML